MNKKILSPFLKGTAVALFLSGLFLTSCSKDDGDDCHTIPTDTLKIETFTLDVPQFDDLRVNSFTSSIKSDIYIIPSDKQEIKVKTYKEVNDLIEADTTDGVLMIDANFCIKNTAKFDVYAYTPAFKKLTVSTPGKLTIDEPLNIEGTFDLVIDDDGSVLSKINADTLNITVNENAYTDINLSGTAKKINITVNGNADIYAKDFTAEMANILINGVAKKIEIDAKSIDATIVGYGNIFYVDSTATVRDSITLSGSVVPL